MLEIKELSYSIGSLNLFEKVNMNFEKESIVFVTGESGCGKTTLLRLIANLIFPISGEIFLNNTKVSKVKKGTVVMHHQHYTNFPWKTCFENAILPIQITGKNNNERIKEVEEKLKKLKLYDFKDYYPSRLSGGMNQRLSLIRTLTIQSEVLLLDEPFSALDEETKDIAINMVKETHDNLKNMIFMVSHDREEIERMKDVNKGKKIYNVHMQKDQTTHKVKISIL